MSGSWFFDENFNGVSDDFFDDAINIFDYTLENVESNEICDWDAKFQHLEPPPLNLLTNFCPALCDDNSITPVEAKKNRQARGICSNTSSRQSTSGFDSSDLKFSNASRTCSPVSVLESSSSRSSSYSAEAFPCATGFFISVKRPRSVRSRLRRQDFPFLALLSSKKCHSFPTPDSDSESYSTHKHFGAPKKRQRREIEIDYYPLQPQVSARNRKCTHCEVTQTPQWREGPLGPKTLCNACGVRYRSGRLLPEYRPAASPTFIPALHSNSHRKVLEMRKKADRLMNIAAMAEIPTAAGY